MSADRIVFAVLGTPRSQPRPRFAKGRVISTADPLTQRWAEAVLLAARRCLRHLGGVEQANLILGGAGGPLTLKAVFMIPTKEAKRWGKPHIASGRYDLDNLEKLIMDVVLGKRGAPFGSDDSRIAHKETVKVWCEPRHAKALVQLMPFQGMDGIGIAEVVP